ncbi:MAG: MerC family mercury resistance protein [Gammaproteobacteria bacterium]|jgi:hypothetical protein|nr:MerC family mercury resistance protein [Gammaproteobacteria bacterium]MDD9894390.1 MerC family mercury resistance protein [Gammaproteobacteria bacterium]MDD9960348.1 MerC family mercury resistance protein [Gammaproteobacteria bacterium]MEC7188593.1 MerC family mercury resistance protein [Pseudomonadota bacterium]
MKLLLFQKLGVAGTLLTAMACPACWPLFATAGSTLGLGVLLPWEGVLMNYVFPPFVVISILGVIQAYRFHKQLVPTVVGTVSGLSILFGFYVGWQLTLMYIGMLGLLVSAVLGHLASRKQEKLCQT